MCHCVRACSTFWIQMPHCVVLIAYQTHQRKQAGGVVKHRECMFRHILTLPIWSCCKYLNGPLFSYVPWAIGMFIVRALLTAVWHDCVIGVPYEMWHLLFKAAVFDPEGLKLKSTTTWAKVNMKKSIFCLIMIQSFPKYFVRLYKVSLGPSMGV